MATHSAPTEFFNTITAIAAKQAQELLRLAETDWHGCQEYATQTIPRVYLWVHEDVIIIRSHLHLEFHLEKNGRHTAYQHWSRYETIVLETAHLTNLTAVLARY